MKSSGSVDVAKSSETHALRARVAALESERTQLNEIVARLRDENETLVRGQEFFRTIVDSEPACVKLVDRDGTLLSMNPAGLAMVEVEHEEQVVGLSAYDMIHPEDHETFRRSVERNFAGDAVDLEFRITGMKGRRREMASFTAPLRDPNGAVIASLAITHDVTERNRDQAELRRYRERLEELVERRTRELEASRVAAARAEKLAALGTLASGLAHELNNPLGTIRLAAEYAAQAEDPASTRGALANIRDDVERCSRIVAGVLKFCRDAPSEKRPLSLNDVVCNARERAAIPANRQRSEIELVLCESIPPIRGNDAELARAILHLIDNALEASPPGVPLEISTRVEGDEVICDVRDHGRGMTDAECQLAFDPFYTTRLDCGGTGLGLSMSHGILRDHDGSIEIESERGRGTRVRLRFPALRTGETR